MTKFFTRVLFACLFAGAAAGAANAQATRTWVSGVGDDANPCSRTAPCKTFAGAISKTAAGGEINCLDSGGFGGVTITKSISIICDDVEGGVLVSGTNAIVVNAGAAGVVVLSGLDIEGVGTGLNGIRFISGAALHVRNTTISDFRGANGTGISFQPSAFSELFLDNVTITENGAGATGGGVLIQPTGAGGGSRVTIDQSDISNNSGFGVSANTTGNTGPSTNIAISRSRLAGSTTGLSVLSPAGTTGITVSLVDSIVYNNGTGISSSGGTTQVAVGNTTIQANTNGLVSALGAPIQSFGDNRLIANNIPGAFSSVLPKS